MLEAVTGSLGSDLGGAGLAPELPTGANDLAPTPQAAGPDAGLGVAPF